MVSVGESEGVTPPCRDSESKEDYERSCGALINRRWIDFSEDDDKYSLKAQISGGEAAVMFTNALSVKLRGSHAA